MAAVLERVVDNLRGVHMIAGVLDELDRNHAPTSFAQQARDLLL